MNTLHIAESGYVSPILEKLRFEGVSTKKYVKETQLNKYNLNSNSYIPVELMYSLFDLVQRTQDIHFLQFFKDTINIHQLSDNVQQMIRTPDLFEILQTTCQFNHLVVSNERMTLNVEGTKTTLKLIVDQQQSLGLELAIKVSMLYTLDGIQVATGQDWNPIEIHYQFKEPVKEDPFIDLGKNVNIRYNMPHSGFVFNTIDLTRFRVRENHEHLLSKDYLTLSDKIELLLDSLKPLQIPNISYFSDHMNISDRSLIRKLNAEGSSFSAILDSWRFKKAIGEMENESITVDELANVLGYANHSNFIRAFKRWTGISPTRYKENLSNNAPLLY